MLIAMLLSLNLALKKAVFAFMLYNIEYVNNVISKKNEKSYRVLWRNAGNQGLLWLFIVAAKQKETLSHW